MRNKGKQIQKKEKVNIKWIWTKEGREWEIVRSIRPISTAITAEHGLLVNAIRSTPHW